MAKDKEIERETFGPNVWLVDEMYRRYLENPKSVAESWQEFFEGYQPAWAEAEERRSKGNGATRTTQATESKAPPAQPAPARRAEPQPQPPAADEPKSQPPATEERTPEPAAAEKPKRRETPTPADIEDATPLRGVAAVIAENMDASLEVPTATSVRTIPAKLLEENRRVINRYLSGRRGGKVSFTHLIGWAVLKALEARPRMKAVYAEINGKPHAIERKRVNLGLAVDVERSGGRTLIVPNIKNANDFDFAGFFSEYEVLIRKVKSNALTPDDFAGTSVTLTNPGTVGTTLSVPRLLKGQGVIVGVGAIGMPTEYEASDPTTMARIGVSKVITITSTYDHRVIQGAESGEFLAKVHDLLLGGDRFYDELFASLGIPYEPVRWSRDHAPMDGLESELDKQSRVIRLINMYRVRGHLLAELNPIGWEVLTHPELDLSHYGLTVWDLDREFLTDGLPGPQKQSLRQILDTLRDAYCRTIGVEYMHISDPDQKKWIQERVESGANDELPAEDKRHILDRLNAAEALEKFIHAKYMGHKRFSIEGAETLIPMLDELFQQAAAVGTIEVVMGSAHRGRLNILANSVGKPLNEIFREFEGDIDPNTVQGSGDVKYHLGMTGRFTSRSGNQMAIVLASNPSHLEAVDPVVEGMARAKQDMLGLEGFNSVLPVLLHGDAAFAGQGVVAETLNMSQLPGYRTGGTIHIVVNNNIGFTTSPAAGRSTTYATDVAKMVQAPIWHVNGDDPEACIRTIRLAFEYRQRFHKDVVVDLVCYRRYGHNEADEPAFTQPLMYSKIDERRSVRKLYTEHLLNRGELTVEEAEESFGDFRARLQQALDETKGSAPPKDTKALPPAPPAAIPDIETGVERERLEHIQRALTTFPSGFEPHPKLKKMIEKRGNLLDRDAVDWAMGEALAWGSLLMEGVTVRLSGQDSRRGTFSQRHSVLVDYRTEEEYTPLNNLSEYQAPFRAFDSLLSEFAALGFEYGYSVADGDALVCWEAQFGDFVNGGQVIIDQFIVAGEDKWDQQSGLVLLLPHGFEGQGPEHSSARLERFLTLAAEGSIQVAQPTSAAQYFHLLRRQAHPLVRKPLIVMTPKSLLRHPDASSTASDFTGGRFELVLDDPRIADKENVNRVLLCSGKIAYQMMDARDERKAPAAVVRLEQIYPFPEEQLAKVLSNYPDATEVRWVQEEPENMGAWWFVFRFLEGSLPGGMKLGHVARPESASPATGSGTVHEQEQKELIERAFAGGAEGEEPDGDEEAVERDEAAPEPTA